MDSTLCCLMFVVISLASVSGDCAKCTSQSDIECQIERSCVLPASKDQIWPGQPRQLTATEVKVRDEIVTNYTWRLPYDSSYLHVQGFLLHVFIVRPSNIPIHPLCYFYNLTTTNWSKVKNPHDAVFKFDCLKFKRSARVVVTISSVPKPPNEASSTKLTLIVHGISDREWLNDTSAKSLVRQIDPKENHARHADHYPVKDEDPCNSWRPSTRITYDNFVRKLEARIEFIPYDGKTYKHEVILLDDKDYLIEEKHILMPNHTAIFKQIKRNMTYTVGVRPLNKSGYLFGVICRSHPFTTPAEQAVYDKQISTTQEGRSSLSATLLVISLVLLVTIATIIIVLIYRRKHGAHTTVDLSRSFEEQLIPLDSVNRSGVVVVFCSETPWFKDLVEAFVAFLRRFTRTEIISHTDPEEQGNIRSGIGEWVNRMHRTRNKLIIYHEGLSLLYEALHNGKQYPKYKDVYKRLVLEQLKHLKRNSNHGHGDSVTVVKICPIYFKDQSLRKDIEGEVWFDDLWRVYEVDSVRRIEFDERQLINLLLCIDKFSRNETPLSISTNDCKHSPEGCVLKDKVLQMISLYEHYPDWTGEIFGLKGDL